MRADSERIILDLADAVNPATHKKIALRLLSSGWLTGFGDPAALRSADPIELLPLSGPLVRVARGQLQAAYFLSDFSQLALLHLPAPRGELRLPGVRMQCRTRDRQMLEGILASDLLALPSGLDLTPLYARCPWQRVYLPMSALDQLQVVEVVRPVRHRRTPAPAQILLFAPQAPAPRAPQGDEHHAS